MKLLKIISVLLFVAVLFQGCKKNDDNPSSNSDNFTNKLTLGTSANLSNFTLSGETTSFALPTSGALTIYWRLEYANDIAGSNVQMKIEKLINGTPTAFATYYSTNPQNYGHIVMSSFSIKETGTYKITGILVTGSVSVASQNFTVQ